jgi:hypothetical protein
MPVLKLYSEVIVKEEELSTPFFTSPGRSLYRFILSIFSNRNYKIDQRISRIKKASSKPWSGMTEQERITHIYHNMAEDKAIQRLRKLKS